MMKTNLLFLLEVSVLFFRVMMIDVQAQEVSSSTDSQKITASPLMMMREWGNEGGRKKETDVTTGKLSADEQTAQNRRNAETATGALGESSLVEVMINSPGRQNQKQGHLVKEEVNGAIVSPKNILFRGYLRLTPAEFKIIAGAPQWVWGVSRQYYELIDALTKYQSQETREERKNNLLVMKDLVELYLKKKEEELLQEKNKTSFSCENVERLYRRIDACALLLKGIEVEEQRVNDNRQILNDFLLMEDSLLSKEIDLSSEDKPRYQSHFALEVMMNAEIASSQGAVDEELFLEELEDTLGGKEKLEERVVAAALGEGLPNEECELSFPDFLLQESNGGALLEHGQLITAERASELVQQGAIYFKKRGLMDLDGKSKFQKKGNFAEQDQQKVLTNDNGLTDGGLDAVPSANFFDAARKLIQDSYVYLLHPGDTQAILPDFAKQNRQSVQRVLIKTNEDQIHANTKECLRKIIQKYIQNNFSLPEDFNKVHSLGKTVVRKLIEEEHAWKLAVKSYEEERENDLAFFSSTNRQNHFDVARSKRETVSDDLLWVRLHQAERAAAIAWDRVQKIGADSELLGKRLFRKLTEAQGAWIPLFSRNAIISPYFPSSQWEHHFEAAKKEKLVTPFYRHWREACDRSYLAKKSVKNSLIEAKSHSDLVVNVWDKLIDAYRKKISEQNNQSLFAEEWQKQIQAAEYQKNYTFFNSLWIQIMQERVTGDLLKSKINKITNSRGPSNSVQEINELVDLWNNLINCTELKKTHCDHFVEKAEELHQGKTGRFDGQTKKDADVMRSFCRFKAQQAKKMTIIASLPLSVSELKSHHSEYPLEELNQAAEAWREVVASYEKCPVPEDWMPGFFVDQVVIKSSGDSNCELSINTEKDFRDAMLKYGPETQNYKSLQEILGDRHPAREAWNLEIEEVKRIGEVIDVALKAAIERKSTL